MDRHKYEAKMEALHSKMTVFDKAIKEDLKNVANVQAHSIDTTLAEIANAIWTAYYKTLEGTYNE